MEQQDKSFALETVQKFNTQTGQNKTLSEITDFEQFLLAELEFEILKNRLPKP